MLFWPVFAKLQHRSAASLRSASSRRNLCSLSDSALDCFFSCVFCAHSDLSSLESAVADKHRVLPVFSRNRPPSSPLEATLTSILVSVDSKWFTAKLNRLDATLTKNTGGGALTDRPPLCASVPLWQSLHLPRVTEHESPVTNHQSPHRSHCSQTLLVQQLAKARDFSTFRGNNSAPPGV